MLSTTTTPTQRRQAFRAGLTSGELQVMPGAFTPLSVRLIQEKGFQGAYISDPEVSDLVSFWKTTPRGELADTLVRVAEDGPRDGDA